MSSETEVKRVLIQWSEDPLNTEVNLKEEVKGKGVVSRNAFELNLVIRIFFPG